ncbi:uncharacterized protein LOC144872256 [Branchiostoma floridae x Branchiostoma japonicum]
MAGNTAANIATKDQSTPLHEAAAGGHTGTCELLIHAGADVTAINKEGMTPSDYARDPETQRRWKNLNRQVKQEKSYHELMQKSGGVKFNRFKVFLGGNETNGKSTLKQSLTKGLLSALIQKLSRRSAEEPYDPTPGVDIGTFHVPGVGEVSVWDFAGQAEYAVTHNMFMDAENTVFIVLYNILNDSETNEQQVHWWLCFIKSCNPNRQPDVILVASHADRVALSTGQHRAALVIQAMKAEFQDHLRIADEVILMNCRKTGTPEMNRLKKMLVRIREDLLKHQKDMPHLCAKIMDHLPGWYEKTGPKCPVMRWPDYVDEVKRFYELPTEDFLEKSTRYLHHMGEILFISPDNCDPILVLKPNWLGTDVFGRIMAPDDFPIPHRLRTSRDYVTREEIQEAFQDVADVDLVITLLQEFQLCHTFDQETYVIPGLLKQAMPDKVWKSTQEPKVVYFGKQVQCAGSTDMFSSAAFPRVQTRLMREMESHPSLWRDGAKCVDRNVEGLIKLSPDGRAVNICVRSVQGDKVKCGKMLQQLENIIADVLYECSPGTSTVENVLSARALKEHREEFYFYSKEQISKAAAKDGTVVHPILKFTEQVNDLLCREDEDPDTEETKVFQPLPCEVAPREQDIMPSRLTDELQDGEGSASRIFPEPVQAHALHAEETKVFQAVQSEDDSWEENMTPPSQLTNGLQNRMLFREDENPLTRNHPLPVQSLTHVEPIMDHLDPNDLLCREERAPHGGSTEAIHGGSPEAPHGGSTEAPHGGSPEAAHGGTTEAPHGGSPEAAHGGSCETLHGDSTETPHGDTTEALHGGSTEALHGGSTEAAHGGSTEAAHGGSTEAPHGGSTEAPHGGSTEAPHGGSTEAPHGGTTEAPHGGSSEAPHGGSTEAPLGGITEAPHGGSTEAPHGGSTEAPHGGTTEAPLGGITEAPHGGSTEAPHGGSTEAPHGGSTEAPHGGSTEAPHGGSTEAPHGGSTEAPHGGSTEAPHGGTTEAPHGGSTEAPHGGSTEAPHGGSTEAPHGGSTEAPHGGTTEAPHGGTTDVPNSLQGQVPKVLLINDEYGTSKGGISTINCEVGLMLIHAKAVVYCTALCVSRHDQKAADRDGVQLIQPVQQDEESVPTLDWLTYYHTVHFPNLPQDITCIVGHADITDTAARNIWEQRYPRADLVTINHVLPEDTEYYQGGRKAMKAWEKEKDMLDKVNNAKAAFSVGLRNYNHFKNKYRGKKKPGKHFIFLPRPPKIFKEANITPDSGDGEKVVLSVGRVKNVEHLKGYNLAARSISMAARDLKYLRWVARGISEDDYEKSMKILEDNLDSGSLKPTPRPYGKQEDILEDMMTAHLVLMPSRCEPFGLVGLEAIAAGIPVLISDKTGLAEMILDLIKQGKLSAEHRHAIVETSVNDSDLEGDVRRWARKIVGILKNTESEFQKAAQFKQELVESRYWEESHRNFLQVCGITAVQ